MNRFDLAKEQIYNALWELCGCDEEVYQNACSGLGAEEIMDEVRALAAKLDGMSQRLNSAPPPPPPKKQTYYVTFVIDGRWNCVVEAESLEEAKDKAECYFEAADLNQLEFIDSKISSVEDEAGNFVYER